ncbi:MAG: 4Fe-4S binding protein [Thermodesulfobacteriota bacterium]|nr:4Fe-4S binding protein [Thermodesulfobacteriota bacterium]
MMEGIYGDLIQHLGKISFGLYSCPELERLLKALFTEEETRVAINLSPLVPEPPENVAERMKENPDKIAKMLDEMADKGIIYCSQRGEEKWYKIIQVVPGIFEFQFMRGEVTERTRNLARLFDDYSRVQERMISDKIKITPFARVIPVEKTIKGDVKVFPFERINRYIDEADTISLSICYCRHEKRLLNKGCQHPDDVCLQFGSFARFVVQRGFGKEITREEARQVLKRSNEAGLIHTSNNTRERIGFICNCCICCCGILRSKSFIIPSMAATSNYLAKIEKNNCEGCGYCIERCQMGAIYYNNKYVVYVNTDRCIGCGVCVSSCTNNAISLVFRSEQNTPPRDLQELSMIQLEDVKQLKK